MTSGRRLWLAGLLLLVGVLGGLAQRLGPLEALELLTYDLRLRQLPARTLDARVALVAIDHESNAEFGRWPWDREIHARMVDHLTGAGAAVIAFDVSFANAAASDQLLAEAIERSGRVVLVRTFELDSQGNYRPDAIPEPIWQAAGGDRGVGSPRMRIDVDGRLRRVSLARVDQELRPFGILLLERLTGSEYHPLIPGVNQTATLGTVAVPATGETNQLMLNYPADPGPMHSYAAVLAGKVGPETFQDKVVLIGSTSDFNDFKQAPRPVGGTDRIPGFLVHAATLDTVLGQHYIRPFPLGPGVGLGLSAATTVLLLLLPFRRAAALAGVLLLLYLAAAWWLFVARQLWLPVTLPVLMVGAVLGLDLVHDSRRVREVLGRFMPRGDIEAMLHNPDQLQGASQVREVTVLFADLRDYTTISEGLSPDQVRDVIGRFHRALGQVFGRHGGYVCDFQGDAQMVVFNIEGDDPRHAESALRAASELPEAVERLNTQLGGLYPSLAGTCLAYGVGLCSGEVSVGYLGGGRHLQYTALGDTTNTAARLQGKARDLGQTVVASHTTVEQALRLGADHFRLSPLPPVELKGKAEPHAIYSLQV